MVIAILLPRMKLTGRNRSTLAQFICLGFLIGSLAWELFERIMVHSGLELALGIGPIGFDLLVLSFYFKINPGSFFGLIGGFLLFRYT